MKKSNIAFLTTIFPASKPHLSVFFKSLQKQTKKDFDVIVINDGISNFEVGKYKPLKISEFKVNYTPAKNREFGINKALELGYEYIIWGDSDDYFNINRVEVVIDLLKNNDIIINELDIVTKNEIKNNYLSNILNNEKFDIDYFLNKNIAGMSNIAIKTSLLKNIVIKFDNELIAVDWYFFTILLLQKPEAKVCFTNETATYYRQYEQNTIGINNTVNEEKIKLGIKIKLIHYKNLINFCKENQNIKFVEIFEENFKNIQKLKDKLKDNVFFEKYISVIKSNFDDVFKGWWSEIITIKEFEYYENKINKQ